MNRIEFMNALEQRLSLLGAEDREDALRYYEELFDEAGPLGEQKILDDLDDVDTIARQILADSGVAPDGRPEFMIDEAVRKDSSSQSGTQQQPKSTVDRIKQDIGGMSRNTKIALLIAVLVVTSPVWGGVLSGVIGLLLGFISVIFGLVIAFTAAAAGLIISGFVYLFKAPPLGLVILGLGLVVTALDILLIFPLVKWGIELLVKFIRWAVDTIKSFIAKRADA